jgi:hypothetical protein
MSCSRVTSIFCLVFLCAAAGRPAVGQGRGLHQSSPSEPWKASDEITMSGVVQEVLKQHPEGGPAGFNFVMTASQKPLTVNAGSGLGENIRSQIHSGASVQVTGLTRTMNGQSYLLARELVVAGQAVQVRSKNGFPVHAAASTGSSSPQVRSKSVQNNLGGAR